MKVVLVEEEAGPWGAGREQGGEEVGRTGRRGHGHEPAWSEHPHGRGPLGGGSVSWYHSYLGQNPDETALAQQGAGEPEQHQVAERSEQHSHASEPCDPEDPTDAVSVGH